MGKKKCPEQDGYRGFLHNTHRVKDTASYG